MMMSVKKHFPPVAASLILTLLLPLACGQTLTIQPATQSFSLWSSPQSIRVNATITGVTNLYGYQYDVPFTQSAFSIAAANITEGPFLKTGGVTTLCIPVTISTGMVRYLACTRTGSTNVSGTGNVTTLAFTVNLSTSPVAARINITNSKLSNIYSQTMTHTTANGTVNIYSCFTGEARYCYPPTYGGTPNVGICRNGTLTCASNQWPVINPANCVGAVGPSSELCNNLDEDCDSLIDDNLNRSCSVTHNGTCAVGTETCAAGAWAGCPAPQTEICSDGIDQDCSGGPNNGDSLCLGDIAGNGVNTPDGCINIYDLAAIGVDFGKTSGFINPNADIDKNSIVDIFDLVYVGKDYGAGANC
jgi:hypothetical protein